MNPDQFLARLKKQGPAPVYLFLGQESYQRGVAKQALIRAVLPDWNASSSDSDGEGFTHLELDSTSLSAVLDDCRSLSLFATQRLVWISSAEAALPRRLTAASDDDEEGGKTTPTASLAAYIKAPTPDVVLVLECSRFDFTGDDKARMERVQKFYSAVPDVVEFRQFSPETARHLAQDLIKQRGLQLGGLELAALIDAVGGEASRLSAEIEKLSLYVGKERKVTLEDLQALVPNASQSTIFSLVSALGRKDRQLALRAIENLIRDGEYLPLALTFLGTQFRLAFAAKEAKVTNAQQAQAFFSKQGVRMWRERAEQTVDTANRFTKDQLAKALELLYRGDVNLRDTRPDDRTVMEALIFALTV